MTVQSCLTGSNVLHFRHELIDSLARRNGHHVGAEQADGDFEQPFVAFVNQTIPQTEHCLKTELINLILRSSGPTSIGRLSTNQHTNHLPTSMSSPTSSFSRVTATRGQCSRSSECNTCMSLRNPIIFSP